MEETRSTIAQKIKQLDDEIIRINNILDATPFYDIMQLRHEAADLVAAKGWKDPRVVKRNIELYEEEKKLLALAKEQENSAELLDKKVKLILERDKLETKFFSVEE